MSDDASTDRPEMTSEDEQLLMQWWQSQVAHDERLRDRKVVLKLVGRAMIDPEFRRALVADGERALADLVPEGDALPAGVRLNFLENTPDTVNIVLPQRVEDASEQHRPLLRELLRSRTADESTFFQDDFRDHGNWFDFGPFATPIDQGDVTKDAAVVLPA